MQFVKNDPRKTYLGDTLMPRFVNPARKRFSVEDIGKSVEIEYFGLLHASTPLETGYITVRGTLTDLQDHPPGTRQTVFLDGVKFGTVHPQADCECRVR